MLKTILPFCAVLLLAGCTSSSSEQEEEDAFLSKSKFQLHATTLKNKQAEVVAFTKIDSLYHLIYASEKDQWSHMVSKKMRRWNVANPIELESSDIGALAVDPKGDRGLPQIWLRLENDDGVINRYDSRDGMNWVAYPGNPMLNAKAGELRLTQNPKNSSWLLCISTPDTGIEIWETTNFESWNSLGMLSPSLEYGKAGIFFLGNRSVLQVEGETIQWLEVSRTNEGFRLVDESPFAKLVGHNSAMIYQDENEDVLFSSHENPSLESIPTFGLPLAINFEENQVRFSQTSALQATLIAKRRGFLSSLIGVGASHFSVNITDFTTDVRADLIADSVRIASLFIDRFENTITLDRSLAPLGDQQMVSYPCAPLDSTFRLDVTIDASTLDVMINEGKDFLGTFHLGNSNAINRMKLYVENEEKELPGTILVFDRQALND